jgi:hypothetical protein
VALGLFTAGLRTGTTVYVRAVIEHGTRRIPIRAATGHPARSGVAPQARNLLLDLDDAGRRARFARHDRDASVTATCGPVVQAAGIRVIRAAVGAPRMNPVMDRWIGSCRRELLDRAPGMESAASADRAARVRGLP